MVPARPAPKGGGFVKFDRETHTLHADGRSWRCDPAGTTIEDRTFPSVAVAPGEDYTMRIRRCVVRFESGWSASIVWGCSTYSSNHDVYGFPGNAPFTEEPTTVEVGVIDVSGDLRQRTYADGDHEYHDVETYLSDEGLAHLLDELATMPSGYDYGARSPTLDEINETFQQFERARQEIDDG